MLPLSYLQMPELGSLQRHPRASHQDFVWRVEKRWPFANILKLLASPPRAWANTARKPLGTSAPLGAWRVVNPPRPHTPVYFQCLPDFQVPLTISPLPYSQSQTWLLTVHFSLSSLVMASAFPILWPEPALCKSLCKMLLTPSCLNWNVTVPKASISFFLSFFS